MDKKILWAAAMAVLGWVIYYLFGRQFFFNMKTANPLYKKMKEANEDLIDGNAKRYTTVSTVAMIVVTVLVFVIVTLLCRKTPYKYIAFYAGYVICGLMLIGKNGPEIKKNFETFCGAYYRFVKDDELRTAMFNKKPSQMKTRLHDMAVSTNWIPEFKKQ